MAEPEGVDEPTASDIDRMQALLDELKSSQSKDKDEDQTFKGKNLKEAEQEAFIRVRAHNRRHKQAVQTGQPDSS